MKKLVLVACVVFAAASCGNNKDGAANNADPNKVHPVSEAIPDSMKLVNDSTVEPDVTPGNGSAVPKEDSTLKKPPKK
jgi:hypothetical protein